MSNEKSDTSLFVQIKKSWMTQVLPVIRFSGIALVSYLLIVSWRVVWIPRHNHLLGSIWLRRADTLGP